MAALGQSYPAWLLRGGRRVLEVDGIQFTDSQDQPGSGGGGSSGPINTLELGPPAIAGFNASQVFANGDYTGSAGSSGASWTSLPFVIAADSTVADTATAFVSFVGANLTAAALTDLNVFFQVTDLTGANVASWGTTTTGTPSGGSLSISVTPSGNHWTIVTGTDLTHPGNTTVLHSTAGGVFVLQAAATVGPD